MRDEFQLQVSRKDDESSVVLSSTASNLVARGRRDAALLAVPCNKCGERREPVFAGCVCANCSDALDREWAASTATDWLVTRPSSAGSVSDCILLDTTYAEMKRFSWTSNDWESRSRGFLRIRQATPEEIVHLQSKWGIWSHASGACMVRPATPPEVAMKKQSDRDWEIAMVTAQIIHETCTDLGIQIDGQDTPTGDPRVEHAVEEIAERLRQIGWVEELTKMKREANDALAAIEDGIRLLEMALQQ